MSQTEEITIRVDSVAAQAYRSATEEDRRKLDLLLNLRLRDAVHSDASLEQLMRAISRSARERGMTPEVLESLLNEP